VSPLKTAKRVVLRVARNLGLMRAIADSHWRRQRLLILAFHSVSLDEEHEWRRLLYLTTEEFERRLRVLQRWRMNVLPLDEAMRRLDAGTLPPRSAVLTFDDGHVDFCEIVWPRVKAAGYPATVYPTTYYSEKRLPIFPLACSYVLWKARHRLLDAAPEVGVDAPVHLADETARERTTDAIVARADADGACAHERQRRLQELSHRLAVDYDCIMARRVLQVMTPDEMRAVARDGADVQLHTHRHRLPPNRDDLQREILENRLRIEALTGRRALHLCYPSGLHCPEFFPWLADLNVATATTCVPSLVARTDQRLALPRLVDTASLSEVELEGWLSGVSQFLIQRRTRDGLPPMPAGLAVAR
jgi:peptidoglycan/xylan/chitin deacetylase (PgdA/CDA1 family)